MTNEEICKGLIHMRTYLCATKDIRAITEAIEKLSKSNTGKWDRIFDDKWIFECDQCHNRHLVSSPFCPSCGADMRETL